MKKKIKLITTFASLGLALALMVFGVYAALTETFTVTSSVNFTASKDILVDFAVATTGEGTTELAGTDGAQIATYTEAANGKVSKNPGATTNANDLAVKTATFKAIGDKVIYTCTVTNYAEFDITVTVTLPTVVEKNGKTLTSVTGETSFDVAAATTTPGTATHTVTIELLRSDVSFDATAGAVEIGYSVTAKA